MSDSGDFTPEQHRRVAPAVNRLVAIEAEQRALDAERVTLLADALDAVTGVPSSADLPYRALRLELAAALSRSEASIERLLNLAFTLTEHYTPTLAEVQERRIGLDHARVITDAGSVFVTGDLPTDAARRDLYETEVLVHARQETPTRLRPIAQALAARYAEHTLEERHQEAATRRCVRVRDLDAGMAELVAFLPAVEAHAIFDRVTRIARATIQEEAASRAADAEAATAERGSAAAQPGVPGTPGAAGTAGGTSTFGAAGDAAGAKSGSAADRAGSTGDTDVFGAASDATGTTGATGVGATGNGAIGPDSAAAPPTDPADGPALPHRSRDAVRADVLRDLLLSGTTDDVPAAGPDIRAKVQVIVPVSLLRPAPDTSTSTSTSTSTGTVSTRGSADTPGSVDTAPEPPPPPDPPHPTDPLNPANPFADLGRRPTTTPTAIRPGPVAELIGHGPIPTSEATRIAHTTPVWEGITTSPDGDVLSVDRYTPTPEMQRRITARDLHCRAPACRAPAHRCDIDHTIAASDGGPTTTRNLALLCRAHHTLKHHSDWQLTQLPGGILRWTSPTGRIHIDRPPSRVRFSTDPAPPPHTQRATPPTEDPNTPHPF